MAQIILFTKQKQIMTKESRLLHSRGREWDGQGVLGWWVQTIMFGMNGLWDPTV